MSTAVPELRIDEVAYAGWNRNLRLVAGGVELLITLEVGPRILRCGFAGEPSLLGEARDQLGGSGEDGFCLRGGHRFWTAPEDEACYVPDNAPVQWRALTSGRGIEIVTPPVAPFGLQKALRIEALADPTEPGGVLFRIAHSLRNAGRQEQRYSPWAISVLAPGGVALIPQPPRRPHPTELPKDEPVDVADFLPSRRIALWPYTDLTDPRFRLGHELYTVEQRADLGPTKLGLLYDRGWVGYQLGAHVFCKHIAWEAGAEYPDLGVNFELYTDATMLELESLAPALPLPPGGTAHHVEHWCMRRSDADLRDVARAKAFFAALPPVG